MHQFDEKPMIGTNRDLVVMREILEFEISRCQTMAKSSPGQRWIGDRLVSLSRQRIAVSAALVNRRAEAAKRVVDFSRWVSGNGALSCGDQRPGCPA